MIGKTKKTGLMITGLLATFLLPLLIATYLFYHPHVLKLKPANKGVLITPPIIAQELPFLPVEGRWYLLYRSTQCCDRACLTNLLVAHQIIKAVGEDQNRLRSVVLLPEHCSSAPLQLAFSRDYIQTKIIFLPPQHAALLHRIMIHHTLKDENRLYIVDPHGNWILFYKRHYNPLDLYNDLIQLLRVSSIG